MGESWIPPAGYHHEWVEEGDDWKVVTEAGRKCRTSPRTQCPNKTVAALRRSNRVWWHYCAEHMFGRQVIDGKVMSRRLVEDNRKTGDGPG